MIETTRDCVEEVTDILTRQQASMEGVVDLLATELRKSRGDADFYRNKLAVSLNENKMLELTVLELRKELREKDDEISQQVARYDERFSDISGLQNELQSARQYAQELQNLLDNAFDDSGRNRRLLQQHLHYGCSSSPPSSRVVRDGQGVVKSTTSPEPAAPAAGCLSTSGDPSSAFHDGHHSHMTEAVFQLNSQPRIASNFVAGLNQKQNQDQQPGTRMVRGRTLPLSPVVVMTSPPPLPAPSGSGTISTADQTGLVHERSTAATRGGGGGFGSSAATVIGTGPMSPVAEVVDLPTPPRTVPVDLARSMGMSTSPSESFSTANIDNAVASFTSLKSEDLHFVAKVRSVAIPDVRIGIESDGSGSLCQFGFRNDGYVFAVTRTGWAHQRDVFRTVLDQPIPTLTPSPIEVTIEVYWGMERRELDVFVNGENITNGELFMTRADNQPPPYYPTVQLPCVGDEVIILSSTTTVPS